MSEYTYGAPLGAFESATASRCSRGCGPGSAPPRCALRGKTGNFSCRAFLRVPTVVQRHQPDRPDGSSSFNETRIPIRFDIFIYRFSHLALYRPSASPSSFTRDRIRLWSSTSRSISSVYPFRVHRPPFSLSLRFSIYSRTYEALRIMQIAVCSACNKSEI